MIAEYPKMACRIHGEQPCFMVCEHVISGAAAPFHMEDPDEHPGLILCAACNEFPRPLKNVERLSPVCVFCVRDRAWSISA
jgi:hypothetical protein